MTTKNKSSKERDNIIEYLLYTNFIFIIFNPHNL